MGSFGGKDQEGVCWLEAMEAAPAGHGRTLADPARQGGRPPHHAVKGRVIFAK